MKEHIERSGAGARRLLAALLATAAIGYAGCVPAGYSSADYLEPQISDYDYLSRYGEWISVPHYGLVWRPWVVEDWSPFYYGHWVWTRDGWAWVSYEPFGMLVYHYGYWDYSLRYGWVWIPDDVWSPARVQWYTFGDYCAWAPIPPPRMYWPDPWEPWDVDAWIVVPVDYFTYEEVGRYRVGERIRREMVVRGTAVKEPPTVRHVESAIKEPISTVPMERERVKMERDVTKTRPKPGRPGQGPLRKMVLPEREREKVDEHAPKVEREVLTPKRTEPRREREKRDQGEQEQQRREKQPQAREKQTDRGRG